MLILAVETSAKPCGAAIYDTGKKRLTAYSAVENEQKCSVSLMPLVKDMLKNSGVDIADIDVFAADIGAGSFTGVRIGVSVIKGMAFTVGKPCAGVTSGEALAYGFIGQDAVICTAIDAKCRRVYNSFFKVGADGVKRLCDERAVEICELEKELASYPAERIILAGDAAEALYAAATDKGKIIMAPPLLRQPTAAGVCMAAQYAGHIPPKQLMPLYLKPPQAQIEREARLSARQTAGE